MVSLVCSAELKTIDINHDLNVSKLESIFVMGSRCDVHNTGIVTFELFPMLSFHSLFFTQAEF